MKIRDAYWLIFGFWLIIGKVHSKEIKEESNYLNNNNIDENNSENDLKILKKNYNNNYNNKRDYENRYYFAVELDSSVIPNEVITSSTLGNIFQDVRIEESFSIPNHYLISAKKPNFFKRNLEKEKNSIVNSFIKRASENNYIKFVEHMNVKQLYKRPAFSGINIKNLVSDDYALTIHSNYNKNNIYQRDEEISVEEAAKSLEDVMTKFDINDPEFPKQWHLFNPIDIGHDVNVLDVWAQNITGDGSVVAIIDDGLDKDSKDLQPNYFAEGSYDFNDHTNDPSPKLQDDRHGTRCAGEIAAIRNDVCGVGVAFDAKVAGIRILSKPVSDADEALAINYRMDANHIYSCSWGPKDNGMIMEAPSGIVKRSFINGIQNGRDGKGSIFVFASGNGGAHGDNCNFDGYTNSIYSITVGAIDRKGLHPYYSEDCSALMVVTYSSGSGDYIHTTDVDEHCAQNHGGTSAAAPLAAGIFALVLQVRPDITWRDLQYIALESAIPINNTDTILMTTVLGKHFSHRYGYGKIDTTRIVELARNWELVKPQAWFFSPKIEVEEKFSVKKQATNTFIVTEEMLNNANLEKLEHVTVTVNILHPRRGDISVLLTSPAGLTSVLAAPRRLDDSSEGILDWTFMSVLHWGEKGLGNWTLTVNSVENESNEGLLKDWKLNLWGVSSKADLTSTLPLDTEQKETPTSTKDESSSLTESPAEYSTEHSTESLSDSYIPTSSMTSVAETTNTVVEAQPTSSLHGSMTSTLDTIINSTNKPEEEGKEDEALEDSDDSDSTDSNENDNFELPGFLPMFGLSTATAAWLYGALVLILIFIIGLSIGFLVQYLRRKSLQKKTRNNVFDVRDAYEFELLPHDELSRGQDDFHDELYNDDNRGFDETENLNSSFTIDDDDEHSSPQH